MFVIATVAAAPFGTVARPCVGTPERCGAKVVEVAPAASVSVTVHTEPAGRSSIVSLVFVALKVNVPVHTCVGLALARVQDTLTVKSPVPYSDAPRPAIDLVTWKLPTPYSFENATALVLASLSSGVRVTVADAPVVDAPAPSSVVTTWVVVVALRVFVSVTVQTAPAGSTGSELAGRGNVTEAPLAIVIPVAVKMTESLAPLSKRQDTENTGAV